MIYFHLPWSSLKLEVSEKSRVYLLVLGREPSVFRTPCLHDLQNLHSGILTLGMLLCNFHRCYSRHWVLVFIDRLDSVFSLEKVFSLHKTTFLSALSEPDTSPYSLELSPLAALPSPGTIPFLLPLSHWSPLLEPLSLKTSECFLRQRTTYSLQNDYTHTSWHLTEFMNVLPLMLSLLSTAPLALP